MTATYIHTRRKLGFSQWVLRILTVLYFIGLTAVIGYLWLFTQDRFITESAFRISEAGSAASSGLSAMMIPGVTDSGSADSQTALGYVNSADLLMELEKEFNLQAHYSSPTKDFVFRLAPDAKIEDRLAYYRSRIVAHYDTDTGLTMLTVDTFSPKLSNEIAISILKKAETFVNTLNKTIADQQLSFTRSELERSTKNVDDLNKEMLTFQNEHNLIDPTSVIAENLKSVQSMEMERLRTQATLASILRDSPQSPQIDILSSKLKSLDEFIASENKKLSGPENGRLNQILLQFQQLKLKLDFAIRQQTTAEAMQEKNRVDAIAKSRFFSVIQNPYLPEAVGMPLRPYATVSILVLGLLVFLILRALTRSVFERA